MRAALVALAIACGVSSAALLAQAGAELRFGGDAEGGAPFMEADPNDISRVVGFEVDIAALLAAGLGRTPRFVQVGFTTLDPAAGRGDFDIGLSGIEDNAGRHRSAGDSRARQAGAWPRAGRLRRRRPSLYRPRRGPRGRRAPRRRAGR